MSASCTSRVRLDVRMTSGGVGGPDRAELGNRDLELGQQLEEVALELLVGAIDLVDQQDRRARARRIDRLQQRPLDQERVAVELAPGAGAIQLTRGLEDAQLDELARVVPLVDGVRDVESFVALQPDQVGLERRRDGAGERRLADAGLAFEKQRPAQPDARERPTRRDRSPRRSAARARRCCRSVIEPPKVPVTAAVSVPLRLLSRGGRRRRRTRGRGGQVVPVHHRVEHHVELAVVLPAVDRIVGRTGPRGPCP